MSRSTRVIKLGLHLRLVDLCAGAGGWLITFDFFNGGPCFDVGRISRARVFVTVAATIAVVVVIQISSTVIA